MMNRNDSTNIDIDRVTRMRALIERSSLGEEGARMLAQRTPDEQVDRIRQRLTQLSRPDSAEGTDGHSADTNAAPVKTTPSQEPTLWPKQLHDLFATAGHVSNMTQDAHPQRLYDLVIHSRQITLTPPPRVRSGHLETYLVLMYDSLGAWAWITTPTSAGSGHGKYRFSSILATHEEGRQDREIMKHSFSIASNCFSRHPSSKEIFSALNGWFPEGENSRSKPHETLPAPVQHIKRKYDVERNGPPTNTLAEEREQPGLPRTGEAPMVDGKTRPGAIPEVLVIAINQRGVGLCAEIQQDSTRHIYNAIRKAAPDKRGLVNKVAPKFREEIQQVIELLKPGERVAKSWTDTLDIRLMHDIIFMFSEIIKNIDGISSGVVDPILNAHLDELKSKPSGCPGVIDTTWRPSFDEEVKNHESHAGHRSTCSS